MSLPPQPQPQPQPQPETGSAPVASTPKARGDWARLAGLLLILAAVTVLAATTDLTRVLDSVREAGPAAAAAFVFLYAGCTLAGVPRHALSTTTGVVYGLGWGLPLAYIGSLLGAGAAFWLARRLGRAALTRLGGPRMAAFNKALARRGFWAVLGARLTPVLPFAAFNYAAGASDIDKRSYAAGTLVGVVPGTVGYVAFGALATAPGPWMVPAVAGVLLLVSVVYLSRRRDGVRHRGVAAHAGDDVASGRPAADAD